MANLKKEIIDKLADCHMLISQLQTLPGTVSEHKDRLACKKVIEVANYLAKNLDQNSSAKSFEETKPKTILEAGWTSGGIYFSRSHYFEEGKRDSVCTLAMRLDSYPVTEEQPENACKICLQTLKQEGHNGKP